MKTSELREINREIFEGFSCKRHGDVIIAKPRERGSMLEFYYLIQQDGKLSPLVPYSDGFHRTYIDPLIRIGVSVPEGRELFTEKFHDNQWTLTFGARDTLRVGAYILYGVVPSFAGVVPELIEVHKIGFKTVKAKVFYRGRATSGLRRYAYETIWHRVFTRIGVKYMFVEFDDEPSVQKVEQHVD